MTKKRAIVSYEKLTIDQKKQLLVAFPDGFAEGMTQIKTPTGETLDALFWETEEVIYLVKLKKQLGKPVKAPIDDDEEEAEAEDFEDDIPDDVKEDETEDDDVEGDYDVADETEEEEEADEEGK